MTNSIDEIQGNDLIFIIGSNTTENHPVIGTQMRQAIKKDSLFNWQEGVRTVMVLEF